MSESAQTHDLKEAAAPLPPSTNKTTSLSQTLQRLSIGTATTTALPSSPHQAPSSPSTLGQRNNSSSSPNGNAPPRSPLHRSPSSMSLNARSSTPTLHRKASMNSLQGVGGVVPARSPSRASPSRRSSSSSFLNGSTMVGKSPLSGIEDEIEAPPRHTAASIASNHFKTELELDGKEEEARSADTIVILHDAVYGHRYSRPRTSKAALGTIVERPERIHASILGVSVAYVRIGERHAEGQYPLHPKKDPTEIPTIPFRIRKTTRRLALSSQAVTNVHGTKWMEELKIMCDNAESKLAINGKELTRPDMNRSPEQDLPAKLHEGDLYLCSESLNAMEGALGAVCEGVDAVFHGSTNGKGPHRTFIAIRPPGHHCSASYPSGFCWLNNVHVGISHAALTHQLTHAAIIDFDLHHGDGSQAIAWEHNSRAVSLAKNALPWKKTSIGYFSLHDINSYPCEMGDEEKVKNASLCIENAHGQSIWNVHLQPWRSETEFWELYENKYSVLLEKARNFLRTQTERLRAIPNGAKPKAAIFLSAGFDASEWESSGMQRHKVNVPTEFYARLTRDVVKLAAEDGTGVDGRIISVLEGGYSDRALCSGVLSHISGLAGGDPTAIKLETKNKGLGYEMGRKIGAFDNGENAIAEPISPGYDPSWWSLPRLEQLDATVNPPPVPEPKKPRDGTPPTYSSPTQSFIAKVASPSAKRTVSNMSLTTNGSPKTVARPPSPPPPEVDWAVAAHELSKLLIPSDRQTKSCRPEDLSAEATRARRDRQSILTPPASISGSEQPEVPRMALRVRKPAKPLVENPEEEEVRKPATKTNRRKTVAGAAIVAAEKATARSKTPLPEPSYTQPTQQSSRRLSTASNTSIASEHTPILPNGHGRVPSNGTAIMARRPSTSQGVRPDSAMSSRGHSIPPVPPVVVKKTRAPAQARHDPAKTSRVRRKSPLSGPGPSVPTNEGTVDVSSSSAALPTNAPSSSQTSDIDSLTSGMKKIRINLTTKSQREAKVQGKAGTPPTTSTAAIKPASIRPTQPPQTQVPPSNSSAMPTAPFNQGTDTKEAEPKSLAENFPPTPSTPPPAYVPSHIHNAAQIPLPVSSPAEAPFPQPTRAQPSPASSSDVFIPYQPEGPTQNTTVQHEPLRWLPPNTSTPSPMKRGDPPMFTATSAIPFGPNPNASQVSKPQENPKNGENRPPRDDSIWEVPETPEKKR